MKARDRVFWGLAWAMLGGCFLFMVWYSVASVRAYWPAAGQIPRAGGEAILAENVTPRHTASHVLDRGDCQVLEEYLRRQGHCVRVFCGTRQDEPRGLRLELQVQLPGGRIVTWPVWFGPKDNSRTLAGDWPQK